MTANGVPFELLRCPITRQAVAPSPESLLRDLQERQQRGELRTRSEEIAEPFDGGLLTVDGALFYPVRSGIPAMLSGEAIPVVKD